MEVWNLINKVVNELSIKMLNFIHLHCCQVQVKFMFKFGSLIFQTKSSLCTRLVELVNKYWPLIY
jgi:hypothetical protein